MGVWSGAEDGWDELDRLIDSGRVGYAAMYHERTGGIWGGPTGFYQTDYRSPMEPGAGKTWDSLYVWADPSYKGDTMFLTLNPDPDSPPPIDRTYNLELLQVPDGLVDAPPVGSVWDIPTGSPITLEIPTYRTKNGLDGYRFAFTMNAVPEPTTISLLAIGAMTLLCSRKRR